jgi:DNA-directed RNA polymerase subunit RPC12/RpoP
MEHLEEVYQLLYNVIKKNVYEWWNVPLDKDALIDILHGEISRLHALDHLANGKMISLDMNGELIDHHIVNFCPYCGNRNIEMLPRWNMPSSYICKKCDKEVFVESKEIR